MRRLKVGSRTGTNAANARRSLNFPPADDAENEETGPAESQQKQY